MADDKKTYEIDVETGESIARIRELTQENKALVKEMNKLDVSTEEGADRFKELSAAVSENNRSIQLLKENIKDTNKEIVAQDKYGKGLKSTLTETKNAYLQAGGGIRGMTAAAKTFIATPLGATLAVITGAFALFKKALEKSEKGQRFLAKATGVVNGTLRTLGDTLINVGSLLKDVFTGNWKQLGSDIDEIKKGFLSIGDNIKEEVNDELDKLEEKPEKIKEKVVKAAKDTSKELEKQRLENEKLLKSLESGFEDFYLTKEELAKKANQKEYDDTVANLDKLLAAGTISQAKYDEMKTQAHQIQIEKDWMLDEAARQAELDAQAKHQDELDKLAEESAKKRKEKEKEVTDAKIALANTAVDATADTIKAVGSMLDADNKKSFEAKKALDIADTTISTIKGAAGAFLQATSAYPPPYGQIIGAITAGVATAAGVANIAKIKSQKYKGGSSPSASTPQAKTVELPKETTTSSIQGVQSDLAMVGQTKSVRGTEARQTQTVLVVDDVTAKQNSQNLIEKTSVM